MKRRFTILTAALALLVCLAIPMGMWGQTATFSPSNFSGQGTSGTGSAISATVDGVTFACDKGYGTTQIRCYSGGTITISSSNTITAISFTFSGSYTGGMETSYTNLSATSWTQTLSSQARITECSVSYTGGDTPQPTTYTVTYNANGGTGTMTDSNSPYNAGATVTVLGNEFTRTGYDFDHWNTAADDSGTSYDEDDTFTINANTTLYAQWTENTTPTPEGETATLNIQAYAEANSWENGVKYTTATVAPVTFTANGGGNTGKYYESGHDWRFYQGESASITISVPEGYTLVSVTPTYSVSNGGVLKNGNVTIASGTTVNVSGTSVTFTVGNSGSATNGQVRFTNIDVVYVSDGGTQTASDLTITNQSTDLTFDLYNNTTAQVISYTTSSTGAITITPTESDYFSYVHDATAKTITVTPLAVTPSAQTVTITQAADDDFYAGTATFTVSVANSDPNQPGTVNNPYTVAEAIAAIDALGTINEAYVSGIVCQVDSYNSNYSSITYWISDDGTTTTKLQVYSGKGIDGADFESIADVQVNDIVVVKGNLKKFNSTYEFDYNNELVSLERPQSTEPSVTVTPNTISAPFAGAEGTLALTYGNIEEFISFDYYFCDANGNELEDTDTDYPGDWIYAQINEENDAYTLSYIIDANDGEARTAYMKVYTFDDNLEEVYAIVTVNQAQYVVDYATLPFEWEGGASADFLALNGVTAQGLGSDYASGSAPYLIKFDNTGDYIQVKCDQQPGKVTIGVKMIGGASTSTITIQGSADSETFTDVEELTISGAQNDELTLETTNAFAANVSYVRMLFTKGSNVGVGPITIALPSNEPSITLSSYTIDAPADGIEDATLNINYSNLTITEFDDFGIQFYDEDENELNSENEPDWLMVLTASDIVDGETVYLVSYMVDPNSGDERTAYFKVYAMDDETNLVYSNLVTISQAAPVAPATGDEYALYTGELVEGDYLIVYDGGAMNTTVTNDRLQYEDVTVNNDVIVTDNVAIVWHIAPSGQYWTIYNADAEAYAASTGAKNKAQMLADGTDDKALWTVTGTETYEFVNKQNTANNVNANLRKNDTYGFACYATGTGGALSLYKKVAEPATETYEKTITGYGTGTGNWYLIASPIGQVVPSAVTGMLSDNYDLFSFDQAAADGKEWRNCKPSINANTFNLEAGTGYLYASKEDTQLVFTGTPYSGDGKVTLTKTDDETVDFQGWNLVGNPFSDVAYLPAGRDYYTMQNNGQDLLVANNPENSVEAMEGVFVIAANDGEELQFTTTPTNSKSSRLGLNLSNGSNVIDRAIVRFGEGQQLPKFQLNKNHTKVYIPVDGKDYAVVLAEEMGEMPVNFKAENNGTYTLSFSSQNAEFAYLHLIDNLTGTDVDMLQSPSYSFEAKTTDYASRFKLVYATGDNSNDDNFAFFSNGSFVINNEGNAELQVIDITGRIVKSESVNGCTSVSVNAAPGVYMLRLVNGDNVKTQKVVVK